MKGVLSEVPQSLLDRRRQTGEDRFDEMWDGVLHMPPTPTPEHQGLALELVCWLRQHRVGGPGTRLFYELNVAAPGGWSADYRVPDLKVIRPGCGAVVRATHVAGPPAVVVEIESAGDESREKLGFYAALLVPEVWIFAAGSREPEVHRLRSDGYARVEPDGDGFVTSSQLAVELRRISDGVVELRVAGDPSTTARVTGR